MSINQLFKIMPDRSFVISLLNLYGIEDFNDTRYFTRENLETLNTAEELKELEKNLQNYYIPCKAKTYLSKLTNNSAMTILRQCIRPFEYNIVGKEKYINGEKIINYHIESKIKTQLKPIIENNHVILTFS